MNKKTVSTILISLLSLHAPHAYAAPLFNIQAPAAGFTSLSEIFPVFFNTIMIVGALVLLFYLFLGAFQYLTAGSNDDNVKKARTTITNAVVGIILLASVWALWTYLIEFILGLPELLGKR